MSVEAKKKQALCTLMEIHASYFGLVIGLIFSYCVGPIYETVFLCMEFNMYETLVMIVQEAQTQLKNIILINLLLLSLSIVIFPEYCYSCHFWIIIIIIISY